MKLEYKSSDFIGRDKELEKLIHLFNESKNGKTRFCVLVADTGIGKTRLVQELYHYLTVADDQNNYWPDNLEDTKHTMTIVPEFDTLSNDQEKFMPWLWLAIRCQNRDERNSWQFQSALSQIRPQIRLHLGGIMDRMKRRQRNLALTKSMITLVANYAFPGGGTIIVDIMSEIFEGLDKSLGTMDAVKNLWTHWKESRNQKKDRTLQVSLEEYSSLVDQTLDIFSAFFSCGEEKGFPVILVVDDAQWADPLTLELLRKLIERGSEEDWPLLIVATCWETNLKEQVKEFDPNKEISNFGALLLYVKRFVEPFIMKLEKLSEENIMKIIGIELRNIGEDAKSVIARNCDGDLELLWSYMKRLKSTPGYINKEGKLNYPLNKLQFQSNRKKELARERILELGHSIACMVAWGSAQGIRFSKEFVAKCAKTFKDEYQVDIHDFYKLDDPYNITHVSVHPVHLEVAEFSRRLYYEVAREILEIMPQSEKIGSLLLEYYENIITSFKVNSLEISEQIAVYEEFRYLVEKYAVWKNNLLELYDMAGVKLLELCLQEGLFKRCLEIGEKLIHSSKMKKVEYKYVLSILIEAAFGSGLSDLEEKYIELYSNFMSKNQDELGEDIESLLYQSKYYLRCDNAQKAIELAKKAVQKAEKQPVNHQSYRCFEHLVTCYFYAGQNQKGFDALNQLESKFKDFINEHTRYKVHLDHYIAIFSHDIDRNLEVVRRSDSCKQGYLTFADRYNHMLSCVNLADGYMAIGNLKKAEEEIQAVYQSSKQGEWVQVNNIAAICYGNILFMQGRLSEAFHYYEEGIMLCQQAKHHWYLVYGLIWRALCLSEFGDPSGLKKLIELKHECDVRGYHYLSSLAATFFLVILAKHGLRHPSGKDMLNAIDRNLTPGLYAQAVAAFILTYDVPVAEKNRLINEMLDCTLECEGIKGCPELIDRALTESIRQIQIERELLDKFQEWKNQYIAPILNFRKNLSAQLRKKYGTEPKIKSCGMKCQAVCCYDGVYLLDGEEVKIKEVVKRYPQYFENLPDEFIVDGNWKDIAKGRKTAVKPWQYDAEDFPAHFDRTRCVFADDDGLCTLQKAATDLNFHPWKFKPMACWAFPLRLENNSIVGPPKECEEDPDYVDETFPGYTKYVRCGRHDNDGISWVDVYRQEILELERVIRNRSNAF
jgi:tetratricopeptide (TPR) repeat protein